MIIGRDTIYLYVKDGRYVSWKEIEEKYNVLNLLDEMDSLTFVDVIYRSDKSELYCTDRTNTRVIIKKCKADGVFRKKDYYIVTASRNLYDFDPVEVTWSCDTLEESRKIAKNRLAKSISMGI